MISKQDFDKFDKQAERWLNEQKFETNIIYGIACYGHKNYVLQVVSDKYLERETKTMISKNFMRMFHHYKTLKQIKSIVYCVATKQEELNDYLESKQNDVGTTRFTTVNIEDKDEQNN